MLKKVVFLGLAAAATVCVAKHAAYCHHAAIKAKSRKNDDASSNSQTVNRPIKVPIRRCPAYALIDVKALRSAYRHSRRS